MDHSAVSLFRRFNAYVRRSDLGFLATAMSPRWYFMDFYVYPPLIALCFMVAVDGGAKQAALATLLVGLGLLVWTLAEYVIHRFAFHHMPGLKTAHLEHHAEPTGLHGSPTIVTVMVFGGLALAPLWYLTSLQSAAALTAGLMLGYLAYVAVHYAIHHVNSLGPAWLPTPLRLRFRNLIRAHGVHHHQTQYNFGVTTTIWDRVFGTLRKR
jgi:sterol desaturase/sphingolipid hydroxylase (fatty acid hydroxylase superfamily)